MRPLLAVMAGIVAALVLLWLVLLIAFAVLRPQSATRRDAVRILPDILRLVRRLSSDAALPRGVRIRLFLLLAYLAFPLDLVPDVIPVLGYADDAIVTGVVMRSVMRHAGPDVVRHHWPGTDDGLAVLGRLCRLPGLTPAHRPPPPPRRRR